MLATLECLAVEPTVLEAHRVLRPGGCLVVCSPARNLFSDLCYRLVNGYSDQEELYGDRRERIGPVIEQIFARCRISTLPRLFPRCLSTYVLVKAYR